jgi:putative tryptophan/tyrosine transport system substrate-binding protein
MRRREFIVATGAVAVLPLVARAQEGPRRLGFLGAATSQVGSSWLAALTERLRQLGWIEGRNLIVDARWADGRKDRAAEIAVEFARANVDIIVTWATDPALAAKQATFSTPIVFALATDPVGAVSSPA